MIILIGDGMITYFYNIMGCCERKRQKPVEEERDIPLEEALERVNKLHEQLQKEYGDGKVRK